MTTLDNDLKTVFETKSKKSSRISSTGKILIGLTGGVAIGLSVICYPFVAPALRKVCLPFVSNAN